MRRQVAFSHLKGAFLAVTLSIPLILNACSSSQKNQSTSQRSPDLQPVFGKKVALVSVEGEPTAKKIIEVALVNQLVQKGTFILVSKEEVEAARSAYDQDPLNWKGIAQKAGADYALKAKVLQFEAPFHEGYSTQQVVDTQLGEEQGTEGKTERVFKVKSLDGHVKIELAFIRLSDGDKRTAIAEEEERVEATSEQSAIHLPPQLRFLENLTNKAFQRAFERFD